MNRECIFFQWRLRGETDYGCVIMSEAIKEKIVKLYTGPQVLRNRKWAGIHQNICRKWHGKAFFFYLLYLPERLSRRKKYLFLFDEYHPSRFNLGFMKWIRNRFDIKTVLVLRNMLEDKTNPAVYENSLDDLKKAFDLVVTDEKKDAELFNLMFLPDPFSKIGKKNVKIKYDLYFIGADKGRSELLSQVASMAKENQVSCNIIITDSEPKDPNLRYMNYQPYLNILHQDLEANCLLEILQPGQESYTLRFQEAVCLGKKLLTNNPNVIYEKYYNPQYIQVFERVEDIDWEFVKTKTNVDYKYKGEYSPVTFLQKIEQELDKKSNT